ncbi:hypothetical protein GUITHDRAFT_111617 [Guillardia theta CCMP2712]|uniref:EF-hand domain-containing protein n=1 Tax=Guillardia theta (strain CCMP2712) TaxID=905079 RepID=L1J229_GUITC|nr:hypothetical protein GUITHDRAFT_111617 [Guillardia theta CCMP2712]EKX42342.1 hypothetical protein GUITHDRAFT_111617 [Guillardia theta CCMP2712]|eukprot:XP_005829322.1 hypothetical protein GUITHDRAFT_111617 [Guillardia theta CCMP2712]
MAAVYVATRKGRIRGKKAASIPTIQFPSEEDSILIAELHRQVLRYSCPPLPFNPVTVQCRDSTIGDTWQRRKVCLSKDKLLLGKVGAMDVIDYIPLDEVMAVVSKTAPSEQTEDKSHNQGEKRASIKRSTTLRIDDDELDEKIFIITTIPEGHNSGKSTVLLASSKDERDTWITAIHQAVKVYLKEKLRQGETKLERRQRQLRRIYSSTASQLFFSAVIMASFICAILSAQLQPPDGSQQARAFRALEITYTCIFAFELVVNVLSNWYWPFVSDGGDAHGDADFVVVMITVLSEIIQGVPGLSALRLIRIFKMIRVFRMLNSFRVLINALSSSVIPVLNAFCILLIFTSIFAIIGTNVFAGRSEDFFGNFLKSMFTLFQMATGDSWASATAMYFVVYMLIVNVVLMNIVVAVLLDEFISTVERERSEKKARNEETLIGLVREFHARGPLDPLVTSLMDFSTLEELSLKIFQLYQKMDLDESGSVNLEELNFGLKKLKLSPPVTLTEEDWDAITDSRKLLNSQEELGPEEFETMILTQMSNYVHRKVATAIKNEAQEFNYDVLFAIKSLLFSVDKIDNPIFKSKKQTPRKSKREILKKLFNSPVHNAFSHWKSTVTIANSLPETKYANLEEIHVCIQRMESTLSKIVSDPSPGRPQDLHILRLTDAVEKIQSSMSRHDDTLRRIEEKMSRMERHGSEGPKRPHGGANGGGQRGEEGQSQVGTMLGSDIIVVGKGKQEEREEVKLQSLSQLTAKKKMGRMQKVHSMPIHSETPKHEKLNGSSSAVYPGPSQASPQSSKRLDKFLPNGDPPDGDRPRLPAETCRGKGDYVKLSWREGEQATGAMGKTLTGKYVGGKLRVEEEGGEVREVELDRSIHQAISKIRVLRFERQ